MDSIVSNDRWLLCLYDRTDIVLKPRDYIALHILNCVVCAVTIGVLYEIYFG